MIKTVNVFTNGDSRLPNTWSNLPYFFTKTLISKGIKVNRIDLSPSPIQEFFFNQTVMRLVRRIRPASLFNHFHSGFHFLHARKLIKRALKQHADSDANIFLTFSFSSAGLTAKPTVLICDWTVDYIIRSLRCREPDFLERSSIERQDKLIEAADLVVELWRSNLQYMQQRYRNGNICHLGNTVNLFETPNRAELLRTKADSPVILFIGGKHYMEGAETLIAAYRRLVKVHPNVVLHIIGMQDQDFVNLPSGVKCHGYLAKSDAEQGKAYYALIRSARVLVNTTLKNGAYGAMFDAMFFYTPVITARTSECVAIFGDQIGFGFYCDDNSEDLLHSNLKSIFGIPSYHSLCEAAHEAVKGFTWDGFVDKLLDRIQSCMHKNPAR